MTVFLKAKNTCREAHLYDLAYLTIELVKNCELGIIFSTFHVETLFHTHLY